MPWTIGTFEEFCSRNGIPPKAYGLYRQADDAFCIESVGEKWRIYFSERGQQEELGWARSESQALQILKLFLLEAYGKLKGPVGTGSE